MSFIEIFLLLSLQFFISLFEYWNLEFEVLNYLLPLQLYIWYSKKICNCAGLYPNFIGAELYDNSPRYGLSDLFHKFTTCTALSLSLHFFGYILGYLKTCLKLYLVESSWNYDEKYCDPLSETIVCRMQCLAKIFRCSIIESEIDEYNFRTSM